MFWGPALFCYQSAYGEELPVIDMSLHHSKYSKSVIRLVDWCTLQFLATLMPMIGSQQITRTLIFSPTSVQQFDEMLQHSCFSNDMQCLCVVCVNCCHVCVLCTVLSRGMCVILYWAFGVSSLSKVLCWKWHDMTWFVVFRKLIYFINCTKPHEECCSSHSDRFGEVESSKSVRTENKICWWMWIQMFRFPEWHATECADVKYPLCRGHSSWLSWDFHDIHEFKQLRMKHADKYNVCCNVLDLLAEQLIWWHVNVLEPAF